MLSMSQQKLARQFGLTYQQIQKYENGTNRISASRLHAIAHILKTTPEFFFEGVPGRPTEYTGPSPNYLAEFIASPEGGALRSAFMKIKDATLRRRIVAIVQEMADGDK